MNERKHVTKSTLPYLLLVVLTLAACWLLAGRHGTFASSSDWLCQHSVFPDYFRQQFYQTGEFFPEFAPGIGGGQNIYNFSYYGLYNPVILLSYLLPSVKMSDYLMAACIVSLTASVLLFYYWLKFHEFSTEICLTASMLFLLAGPMIYHSCHQVMFVNYMPFLLLALIGVDRFREHEKRGLYTLGIFLMILTSFYFAIGGILAVLLYGISRYPKHAQKRWLLRFVMPVAAAVLTSGVLLIPTGFALLARSGSQHAFQPGDLLLPDLSISHFAYSGYGVGLTAGILVVLFAGLTYRCLGEWLLSTGCLILFLIPMFSWILNGGLYVRDKALIPFLPVLLFLAALFCQKLQRNEISRNTILAGIIFTLLFCSISLRTHGQRHVLYFFLLCEAGTTLVFLLLRMRLKLFFHDRSYLLLVLPSLICLLFFDIYSNGTDGTTMEKQFYNRVTDPAWETVIADILKQESGLYRVEQGGMFEEKKADLNRTWSPRQWITSVYSSAEHEIYKTFQEETFQTEQPFRNSLMQSVSDNPLFAKLMGVKYRIEHSTDSETFTVTTQEHAAPVIYASDQVIPENMYQKLPFPWRQTALMRYSAVETAADMNLKPDANTTDTDSAPNTDSAPDTAAISDSDTEYLKQILPALQEIRISVSELEDSCRTPSVLPGDNGEIVKETSGYHIQAEKNLPAILSLPEHSFKTSGEHLLFLQFDVENHHETHDVAIDIAGIRNKLTAQKHIYYNGNTTFTYVIQLAEQETSAEILFGMGDYSISNIRSFLGSAAILEDDTLYQSAFQPDWTDTKGNQICGSIHAKRDGYLITSIPYDNNFEILIDGRPAVIQKINTAFLGAAITQGRHQIRMIYHSPGLGAGKLFTCIGLLLWGILVAADRKRLFFPPWLCIRHTKHCK